jgi:hypothetical protein
MNSIAKEKKGYAMKKDKTKNGAIPTDEIRDTTELEQTQTDPGSSASPKQEPHGTGAPSAPSAPADLLGRTEPEKTVLQDENDTPVQNREMPPPSASVAGGVGGNAAKPAPPAMSWHDSEIAQAEAFREPDKVTGTAVNGQGAEGQIQTAAPSATSNAVLNPVAVSFGSDLDPLIYPSLDGSAIAIGASGPPMVILDDAGLKQRLGKTWGDKILSGLDETGRLVGAQRFDNDPEKIFRKGRKPGVVFAAIERLMEGKIDRRRIAESTRGYGVELELNAAGLPFQLPYSPRAQIGRLPEKADRIRVAREAHEKKWSVETIKQEVGALLRKATLDDHQTAQALLRDIQTAGNLLQDEDIREFVKDKKRLKTLDPKARLGLRKGIQDVRHNVALTGDILDNLEDVLWNIEREERERTSDTDQEGSDSMDVLSAE